jgi:hypothetical protein
MRRQRPVEDFDAPNEPDSSHLRENGVINPRHISRRPGVMRMKPVTQPM